MSSFNPYRAFHPMMQLKGSFGTMQFPWIVKNKQLVHLNPLKGYLALFKDTDHFPNQPSEIIHLDEITAAELVIKKRLLHQADCFYMKISTKDKQLVLFDQKSEIINFFLNQLDISRKFYSWLLSLVNFRYQEVTCECSPLSDEKQN